ncbi:MAG: TPM domain-containing protein, partial [Ruminococcaceae bacterium]|nr:TPM domain-containing protein [Oscillospiraceae bacterium]
FFDYNGYGFGSSYDGVLLLVSMEDRDWWISTSGYGITAFTDWGIDCLSDRFLPDLGNGFYADAFEIFVQGCDEYITLAKNGTPFDIGSEPFDPGTALGISAVVGLIASLIIVSSMKAQLKTVRQQNAANYLKRDSMKITDSHELFLYRNVSRTVKQESSGGSSTHRSSSGRSHGGGGGKF